MTDRKEFTLEIFVVSFAAVLLEISYTRLISFKFFYYYTYLVIGFALLGIGTGGVLVAVLRGLRALRPLRARGRRGGDALQPPQRCSSLLVSFDGSAVGSM